VHARLEEIVKLTALSGAIAVTVAVLPPITSELHAQALGQAATPPLEWTMDEVVRAAVVKHPLVEAARDRITAARGARQTAGAFSNPVATYWIDDAAFPGQAASLGVARETSTYVTVPLEPFFQRAPRIRRADADVKTAEIALVAARRAVALDAAHAFYRVALAQMSVEVAEQNREGLERLVSYNRSRVTEGATAELELIRAQVELDRASTNVALADVDLAKARAELLPYLSNDLRPTALSRLRVAVPSLGNAPASLAELGVFVKRAQDNRAEMQSARARVTAATTETSVQRALTVRQVGATFGLKRVEGENAMIAGISVPVPLFDRNRGEIQRAAGELLAAQEELTWTERTVVAELAGAYTAVERLSTQVSTLEHAFLDRADETNRITLAAYQEGAATLLQVLDATRTVADARLTYYRAVLAQRQSVFDLAMAAGDDPEVALTASAASDRPSTHEPNQRPDVR
jgi:cobalt-zinc-cadmium efflux system outer membrane protein